MGQSVIRNPRKIHSQSGGDPSLPTRVTTLENNEYKITYYEVVSGASGSLTLPAGATINAGEFGLSGNCVLSKIDGSNKPTFESPKTAGGTVVTASLNETTGAWVASGVYTDVNVALIYSIKIKAINYGNLTYDNIIETVDDIPTVDTTIIDGSTNAVSGNAVFDGLATKANNLLAKQNITITHTGTTAETKIYSSLIPAGSVQANDVLKLLMKAFGVSGVASKSFRMYFNTSNAIGGVQVGLNTIAATVSALTTRNIFCKNSLSSQQVIAPTTSVANEESTNQNAGSYSIVSIDFAVDQYFIVSCQLTTGAESAAILGLTLQAER